MTEPHMIRIDSRDLRDLIDGRDRLESSLAECARSAMTSADEWSNEVDKANHIITELRVFEREIQEALGYDQPDLIPHEHLAADIRGLVEQRLAGSDRSAQHIITDVRLYDVGPAGVQSVQGWSRDQNVPADTDQPAETAGIVPEVDVYAQAAHALDNARENFASWTHAGWAPAGAPAAPHPRTWKAGDPEPSAAGPAAVWGVTTDLGDLYRPQANEELGWFWSRADGTWLRWETMLAAGPVTETFPPNPTPHTADAELPAEDESTPAPEALAGADETNLTSDNTTTTDPAW